MKRIVYQVIFGNSWGTGHLNRAIAFKNNIINHTEIRVILEHPNDKKFIDRYRIPYSVNSIEGKSKVFDLAIDDTLGLFSERVQGYDEHWIIDGVQLIGSATNFDKPHRCWSILYPNSGPPFQRPEIFYKKDVPCAAIFQGGGDDHNQILNIINEIPQEHSLIIGVGSNCRHVPELRRCCEARGKASVMIDFDVRKIARAADYIITSGGNILYEIFHTTHSKNLILFSKENKEHITFRKFLESDRVIRYFSFEDDFKYDDRFTPSKSSSLVKRSLEEYGLI
ncbi:hypothetical protein N9I87_02725 [Gammaproteobacteria bacterium]|nr:hypothetical protein [Gammaproteobacteria bacterium]